MYFCYLLLVNISNVTEGKHLCKEEFSELLQSEVRLADSWVTQHLLGSGSSYFVTFVPVSLNCFFFSINKWNV